MKLWIIVYSHRHGYDSWPVFQDTQPDLDEVAKELDDFEEDREEWLEAFGPFETPKSQAAYLTDATLHQC